jgi:phosphoribosylglycinamide formyltransferase 1
MTAKKRVAILVSGRGSNMLALIKAAQAEDYPAKIALVISNRPEAGALERARNFGIETAVIDHRGFEGRGAFDAALNKCLIEHDAELVACAGFMRIMTESFVKTWRDRMINIHPSLLPSFKGLHTHEQALAAGVRIHGCTVHFVRHDVDTGPIIAQAAVPVLDTDTADILAARVLDAEHIIYPMALRLVASGIAHVEGERIIHQKFTLSQNILIVPSPSTT